MLEKDALIEFSIAEVFGVVGDGAVTIHAKQFLATFCEPECRPYSTRRRHEHAPSSYWR